MTRFLVAIVIASALITPFRRELFVGDETKYSKVVREMRATGAFFLPTLEGTPFTHKPPLHFWIVDLLTIPFGTYSMWPFVLPSLAAFAFLLWLMWRMGGPIAAFVCGTSLMVWGSAQTARMDVGFTAFITLAAWMLQRFLDADGGRPARTPPAVPAGGSAVPAGGSADYYERAAGGESGEAANRRESRGAGRAPAGGRDARRPLTIAGFALAIATLIKGPMAPIIIAVLFALEWWRRGSVPRRGYLPALAAIIIVPLLWFVPAMFVGGSAYTHEVLQKQLAGRAVSSWVHQSPPWYYLAHSPAIVFPWFLLGLAAIATRWRQQRFNVNWILAVLVPYSLLSSKLDVYMMALIPPLSLIIADCISQSGDAGRAPAVWARRANVITLAVVLLIAVAALFLVTPQRIHGPEAALTGMTSVKLFFVVLAVAATAGLGASLRGTVASTIAVGLAPLAAFVYAAVALMPLANGVASTRPIVDVLEQQHVSGAAIALFTSPHLWTHDMPRDLERVQYVSAQSAFQRNPQIIVTSRRYATDLGPQLAAYHRVAEVRMIGKWFDVYRR